MDIIKVENVGMRFNLSKEKIDSLKDLSYTYFTVENIDFDIRKRRGRFRKEEIPKETQKVLNEKIEIDKMLFEDISKIYYLKVLQ